MVEVANGNPTLEAGETGTERGLDGNPIPTGPAITSSLGYM
jgi:hypothetical protein